MLIEFNVANFRSIRETQTLSMVSSKHYKEFEDTNCFDSKLRGFSKLLRTGAIYGPNAAGKSNLLRAIHFMRQFILTSHSHQEGRSIDVEPFAFSTDARSEPSEFEIFFVQDNVRFQYGFAVNKMRVVKESLFAYPESKAQRWFERSYDPSTDKDNYSFGGKFSGQRQLWRDSTRQNALFLSTAIQLNSEQLKPVFNWFKNNISVIGIRGIAPEFSVNDCDSDEGKKKQILEFMNSADINIAGIEVTKTTAAEKVLQGMPYIKIAQFINRLGSEKLENASVKDIKFKHQAVNGDPVYFDLKDESHGTQKLFAYAGPWLDVLAKGKVFIVDELDTSLHLLLIHYLISLIQNQNTNKNNAQLIFTTHNTSLLDTKIFRRDQIWFVERDRENASKLYSLSEFSARKGEAIEKGYLTGRYGALPHIEDFSF